MKRQIFKGFYVRAIHKGHPDMLPASMLEVETRRREKGCLSIDDGKRTLKFGAGVSSSI